MSSADSFLNSAATCFINDLVTPIRRTPLPERQELLLAKLINCLVGILAIIFAVKIKSILDILIYAYNFWAPVIVVPLAAVLLGLRVTRAGFMAGTLAGAASALIWNYLLKAPAGIEGLAVGVLCNLIAFAAANKLSIKAARQQSSGASG
jgi:SSS family solute:Na+ symporter